MNLKNERLFDDYSNLTLEDVVKRVHQLIESDTSAYKENETISKWVNLPMVSLSSEETVQRFMEMVSYIDGLLEPIVNKVALVNTLATMIVVSKMEIGSFETNDLFTLVSYFQKVAYLSYETQIKLLGNVDLIAAVRRSTLDANTRNELLAYIWSQAEENHLNMDLLDAISTFRERVIGVLKEKSAEEVLGKATYHHGSTGKPISFKDSIES